MIDNKYTRETAIEALKLFAESVPESRNMKLFEAVRRVSENSWRQINDEADAIDALALAELMRFVERENMNWEDVYPE